jgi:hypothetical protein
MQISPTSAGVQAAGGAIAQAGAKDKTHTAGGEVPANVNAQVEQSGMSNPDRDAQGQGDGLGDRPKPHPTPEDVLEIGDGEREMASPSSNLPGEPPGELDLLA